MTTAPNTPDAAGERLHAAILSFAQGVNNDFEEIVRALYARGADGRELVDDLTKLRAEWIDASQAALESIGNDEPPACPVCDALLPPNGACRGGVGSEPCTYRRDA